jgi:uncharacterized membrane protein
VRLSCSNLSLAIALTVNSTSTPNWLWRLDAHHRLVLAVIATIVAFLLAPHNFRPLTRALVAWDSGSVILLLLAWSVIVTAHPRQIKKRAQTQDANRVVVAVLVVCAACAALFAVAFLLGTSKNLPSQQVGLHIALAVVTMICSWLLLHTAFTLRYAHYYYRPPEPSTHEGAHAGGLDFPSEEHPDYCDFAYFAFVIGMTFQVSDVAIKSRLIRRVVLIHSLLSFAFYTLIVALSINIISSLVSLS